MSPPPAEQFAARIFMGPALRAQPDRRLVDLVRDGYDAAFEEIVRRYRRPLDRFAAAIVGGRSEDVTQDAFSKALPALRRSEAAIELRPWLYRIVRNAALNDLRDRAPAAAELSETLPGGLSAAAVVEAREELRDLMDRLQALPEPQRAALVMRELEGLSHDEIAAALGVSGGAARQAIYRARATLRDGLGLLVPLPLLRALAEHGGEASAAGGVIAVGSGALKAGMATVLIAGAVGAGVAVEHHQGQRPGPEAAEAAPLAGGKHTGSADVAGASGQSNAFASSEDRRPGRSSRGGNDSSRDGSGADGAGSLSGGTRSGSSNATETSGGSPHSGGSRHSGEDSHSGSDGPGPSSTSGSDDSGSADRHGGRSGSDGGGSGGSGSDLSDDGGSSGGSGSGSSGSDDGLSSGGDSSGSGGGGEIESDPVPTTEPTLSEGSSGGSGSSGSGSDDGSSTSTSGSGDLSGSDSTTSAVDGSP
jgi:RNA polymerase sigma factor (sigma-70 family)